MKKKIELYLECPECIKLFKNREFRVNLLIIDNGFFVNGKFQLSSNLAKYYICPNCDEKITNAYCPGTYKINKVKVI